MRYLLLLLLCSSAMAFEQYDYRVTVLRVQLDKKAIQSSLLSYSAVRKETVRALKLWSLGSGRKHRIVSSKPNVVVSTRFNESWIGYYDAKAISGREVLRANIYIDDTELWYSGLMYTVLLHEFGHALGLKHNGDPQSIMYPFIDKQKYYLTPDDIDGVRNWR